MKNGELYEKNINAEIISCPVLVEGLKRIIETKLDQIENVASKIYKSNPERLVFAGSGNSWSAMYSAKYLMDKFSNLPCELFYGPELITRDPNYINDKIYAIVASYTGKTEDTLNAVKYLKDKSSKTVSITKTNDSPISLESDINIYYESKSLYISAIFVIYILISHILNFRGEFDNFNNFFNELMELPQKLKKVVDESKDKAKKLAEDLADSKLIYICADGLLYALGYQTALTTITEYLRMDASIVQGCEWRHGPLEIVGKGKPIVGFLLGSDNSRIYTEKTMNFCKRYGARTFNFDMKEYAFDANPLLSPFFVYPMINWFILYMSVIKNIDLDEYLYMHVVDY
jgi:fructoselysine-6-P-deglycase FrlB-like protein